MVRIAGLIAIILVSGCDRAKSQHDPLCPQYSTGVIYTAPITFAAKSDNASQCEMYWLSRFATVAGPASDAVRAAMTECQLERDSAFSHGVADSEIPNDRSAYDRDVARDLHRLVMERRYHNCPRPSDDK